MLLDSHVQIAVDSLIRARAERKALAELPRESKPSNLQEAYRIQRAYDQKSSEKIIGYKIGAASAASQKLVGASEPFLASVHGLGCFKSPAHLQHSDFFCPGVEAEYAFEMGMDLPPRSQPYTRSEVISAIAAVYPVIEICDNRFLDWRSTDLMQIIADNGFFGALVIGERTENWKSANLRSNDVTLKIDEVERGRGSCDAVLGDPIDGVVWIANELSKQAVGLAKGHLVPIGTWTGLHFVRQGNAITADFGKLGTVEIAFE